MLSIALFLFENFIIFMSIELKADFMKRNYCGRNCRGLLAVLFSLSWLTLGKEPEVSNQVSAEREPDSGLL
jgi:hypothetical protein